MSHSVTRLPGEKSGSLEPCTMDLDSSRDDEPVTGPFSFEENIEQLNATDKCIAQLMSQTSTALNALAIPASSTPALSGDAASPDPKAQKEAFKSATDSFLATLHSVDVRMKRQIMALEEAGIVTLTNAPRQHAKDGSKASLRPNGLGELGNLDVGWLNSRSTTVERDMEAELWREATQILEKTVAQNKMKDDN